jgi:sporulation protein YlmC with PRC-barrel domain
MPVGKVVDVIIDPDNGKFSALWIRSIRGLRILAFSDITRWKQNEIIVNTEQSFYLPEEMPRLKEIFEKEVPVINAPVFEKKNKIGRVMDITFDTISPRIVALHIRSGFLIFGRQFIVPYSRIKKITHEGIFLLDPGIKVKDPLEEPISLKKTIPATGKTIVKKEEN